MFVAKESRILNYAGDEYRLIKGEPVPEGMPLEVLVLLDSVLEEVPDLEAEPRPEPKALAAAKRKAKDRAQVHTEQKQEKEEASDGAAGSE